MSEIYEELQSAFKSIYANDTWGFGSGIGSLPDTTLEYRYFLEKFIAKNAIKTVVDFGCGDWAFSRYIFWWDSEYTGYDTVDTVIEKNNEQYSTDKIMFLISPRNFQDIKPADLLIVKDVLQHWNSNIIKEFLISIKEKYQYILITNSQYPKENINKDISIGQFRPINLLIPPFNVQGEQVLSYYFHCTDSQGETYSDLKSVILLKNW